MIRASLAWSIACIAAACAEPTGVDLRLVPDPSINREPQVLEVVDTVIMIVDAPGGLYPAGSERVADGVQITDADSDPSDLELVATIPVTEDHLPVIRLEQGTLPDVALDIRFLGVPAEPGAPSSAVGRVQGVRLTSPVAELAVPFNVRPERLPPRVSEVLPTDGGHAQDCMVSTIYVMFSRPIDVGTLLDAVRVQPGEVIGVRLEPSGLTAEVQVSGLVGDGTSLRYGLTIESTLLDLEGRPLDQVPSEPDAQAYAGDFELTCGRDMATPATVCADPVGPESMCPYPARLACIDGYCVPRGCGEASCLDGTLCDPVTEQCTLDCRFWQGAPVCPDDRPICADNGVCVE